MRRDRRDAGGAAIVVGGALLALLLLGAGAPAAPVAAPEGGAAETPAADPVAERKNAVERAAKTTFFRDNVWSPLRAFARYDFPPPQGGAPETPGKPATQASMAQASAAEASAVAGSSPEAQVRLDGPGVEPRHLRLTALPAAEENAASRFRLERLAAAGEIRVGGDLWQGGVGSTRLVPEETVVEIGPFAIRPYVQTGSGILILFDSRRTEGDAFVPPAWFPFDPGWVFHARLNRFPKPETVTMQTSLGRTKEYLRAGRFILNAPGRPGLMVYAYEPTFMTHAGGTLSILFTDGTTGKESYGTGRYLDLDAPEGDLYTVDFNRAYNPLCAYTTVYNCPIPPRENALPVEVRAGEKAYPGHAAR